MKRRRPTPTDLVPMRTAPPVIVSAGVKPTLAELVPKFLMWFKLIRRRSDNTIAGYGLDLRRFLTFCEKAGIEYAEQVTFREVEMYMGWIQHKGAKASTANRHRYALVTFWRWLRREGAATGDPVGDTFAMKEPRRLPKGLSIPEQDRVIEILGRDDSLAGRRDHAVVATGILAGLRVEELATLKIHDVSLEAGVLRVIGKGDKEREIPIVPRLGEILRAYLAEVRPALVGRVVGRVYRQPERGRVTWRARYRRADGTVVDVATKTRDEAEARAFLAERAAQPPEAPWLFVNASPKNSSRLHRAGQALLTRSFFNVVRAKVGPIVGRPVSPHALRHSFASRLRENGAPLELIQEALGHASINTTMIYAHITTAKRKSELAKYLDGETAVAPS